MGLRRLRLHNRAHQSRLQPHKAAHGHGHKARDHQERSVSHRLRFGRRRHHNAFNENTAAAAFESSSLYPRYHDRRRFVCDPFAKHGRTFLRRQQMAEKYPERLTILGFVF